MIDRCWEEFACRIIQRNMVLLSLLSRRGFLNLRPYSAESGLAGPGPVDWIDS